MRLSNKNSMHSFIHDSSNHKFYKKPSELIKKLNNDISTIQTAVNYYNKTFEASNNLRKQIDLVQSRNCPLKALSQPKYQNILLECNFNQNPLFFGKKTNNQSFIKKDQIHSINKFNYSRKSSLQNNSNRNNNNNNLSKNKQMENQNPQKNNMKINTKFSFNEQIGKFDKLVYMSKAPKQNYSEGRYRANTNINNYSQLQSIQNATIFNDSSVSQFIKTNRIPKYHQVENLNDSIIIPFANEENICNQKVKNLKIQEIQETKLMKEHSNLKNNGQKHKLIDKKYKFIIIKIKNKFLKV